MRFVLRWLINAVALWVVAYLVPGVTVMGWGGLALAALILGLVNAIIRPILLLVSLPLEILTLGLFALVVNALCFWFVAWLHVGLVVSGFWAAFWGALILWIVSWILSLFIREPAR